MEGKVRIGKVSRLHGYKGELSLKLEPDYSFLFEDFDFIFLEVDKKPIPYFIESLRFTPKGYALVLFEGVDDQSQAEALRGKDIYVDESSIPEEVTEDIESQSFTKYEVIDEKLGVLGQVDRTVDHSGSLLLLIDREDGEIMIPMNKEIIQKVDHEAKTIRINAPEGLIELNLD